MLYRAAIYSVSRSMDVRHLKERNCPGRPTMRIYPWILGAALAMGLGPRLSAQSTSPAGHAEILDNCLEGFLTCDSAQLNPQEKQAVQRFKEQQNFLECFDGFSDCDPRPLTGEQKREVARASGDHNLQNCLEAIGECDVSRLTPPERQEVAQAAGVRNPAELPGWLRRL